MRGSDERTGSLFSYVGVEGRLRPDHPLRAIRALTDETLAPIERKLAEELTIATSGADRLA